MKPPAVSPGVLFFWEWKYTLTDNYKMEKKIAIQGVHGCFHEQAARLFYGDGIDVLECLNFEDMFTGLSDGMADGAIIAIENTVAGGLLPNYALIQKYGYKVKGEVFLRIKQNLMAMPGQTIADIKEVHSHYMAIAQTREFFKQYPHIKLIESEDTAKSAADIARNGQTGVGAIASELAASLFGLDVLQESIETHKQNFTRFLIMDDNIEVKEEEINKSSICFTIPHRTGRLSQILSIFSFYDLSLTKIQSLPIPGKEWQYFFYVDLKFDNCQRYREAMVAANPLMEDVNIIGEYKSCN